MIGIGLGPALSFIGESAFSPFKVGAPIVLLDPAMGLTFNGSGADLIDEDFDPDPSWTEVADSGVVGIDMVNTTVSGVDATSHTTYASETEAWVEIKFRFDALSMSSGGCGVIGLSTSDATARVDMIESAGNIQLRTIWRKEDSSQANFTYSGEFMVPGKEYTITLHFLAASAPLAADGIIESWLGTIKMGEDTAVANNGQTASAVITGGQFATAASNATQITHSVKVGTTGASPAQIVNWADQSGNGNDVVQATAADQPLFNVSDSDFNGEPASVFDGIDHFLQSADFTGGDLTQPNTIFIVYKMGDLSGTQVLYDGLLTTERQSVVLSNTQAVMHGGTDRDIHTEDTDPHILAVLFNVAASNSWHDGIETTPNGTTASEPMGGLTLGAFFNTTLNANCKVAYMLIYNSNLSDAAKNYIGRGLAARFGTTWTDI